ncbi:MAG: TetR family transcriptional regulator C-terminal domain-containing protein [Bacteroidota bacterium]
MESKQELIDAYKTYLVTQKRRPISIRTFIEGGDVTEATFRTYYKSLNQLENELIAQPFVRSLQAMSESPDFEAYGTYESLQAVFFTWIQELETIREEVKLIEKAAFPSITTPYYQRKTEQLFTGFIQAILKEGMDRGEVASRPFISEKYAEALWLEARVLFGFWLNDNSANREQTDAAVDKAVGFAYDLIRPNALDSGVDFVKFLLKK